MPRPERLVVAMGTATDVGKTWVGARTLGSLRARGVAVAARKPVQSFGPGAGPTDADVLAAATGEQPTEVCRADRWYEAAMAPPMATEVLNRPSFGIADLMAELSWPDHCEVGWVETVGGPRSPIAADGDSAALAAALAPNLVVLIADAGLGAINAVLLCVAVVPTPVVALLNRFDGSDLHRRNRAWLVAAGVDVVVDPDELILRLPPGC
ncbi:MAG: dethiobiotin synthase [Actinomycetota bacterium]|nr:dethiobiotin synthase [Actinomycetota bacterium]